MSELKAGAELDALVAEKVMGWTDVCSASRKIYGGTTWYAPHGRPDAAFMKYEIIPSYSTDIAAAWLVAEHVTRTHVMPLQLVCYGYARTYAKFSVDFDPDEGWSEANGENATPHAICLAALSAVEAER